MSVTGPPGFVAAGVACGIKGSGGLDLALVATYDCLAVPAAAVFTSNLAAAAPVTVSRRHLRVTAGRAAAVVVSSGNANAATGPRGVEDAERMCKLVGDGLGTDQEQVLICQTGLIGIPLPMPVIEAGIGSLLSARGPERESAELAAGAIMTTDTFRKEVVVDRPGYRVGAMAKGAAMLAPDMATMLAILTTDARCDPAQLASALGEAVRRTFNRMSVDGCTSTNDTVLVLANGRGVAPAVAELTSSLEEACAALSSMMVADAEGATKVARIVVKGAASDLEAERAARKVAESLLVKCSLNGEDPYWGRVVSELGSAGVSFDIDRVEVAYGAVPVCRAGVAVEHDRELVRRHMKQKTVEITCDLGMGGGSGWVLGCDLGHGYIDENRTTS